MYFLKSNPRMHRHYDPKPKMFGFNRWEIRNWGGDEEDSSSMDYQFKKDPYAEKSQAFALPYYTDMLEGKVNDYYKPIGESGGAEFEEMMGLTRRDITQGVTEDAARRNLQGGTGSSSIAKAIADSSVKGRFADYSRALKGKESLLNIGSQGLSGVRSAGLTNQGQENQVGFANFQAKQQAEQASGDSEGGMWEAILGTVGTVAGSLYGGSTGGAIGGSLGSAAGGLISGGGRGQNVGTGSSFALGSGTDDDFMSMFGR